MVWVDGMPLDDTSDVDRFVRPSEVTGIEVYADGVIRPPDLAAGALARCGAIAIWTY